MLTFTIIISDERAQDNRTLKYIYIQCDDANTPITLSETDIQTINNLYNSGIDESSFFTTVPEIKHSVKINWCINLDK